MEDSIRKEEQQNSNSDTLPLSNPKSGSIMIVDDVESIRSNITNILKKEGFCIVGEASSGDMALEMIKTLKPDLVIMDVYMEGIDGIETTRRIARDFPGTKVIIMTQLAKPSVVTDSIRAGAQNFIIKPFEDRKLISAVKNALMH